MRHTMGRSKMLKCQARKKHTARRKVQYVKRCGLKWNTVGERSLVPFRVFQQPNQSLNIAPVEDDVTNFAYLAR